jgi:hypothetical protein
MLARPPGPSEREAGGVGAVSGCYAPRRDLTGADLGAWRIMHLNPRSLRSGRAGERLRAPLHLAGDLGPLPSEIVCDLELDGRGLEPAHLLHQLGEAGRPAAGFRRQRSPGALRAGTRRPARQRRRPQPSAWPRRSRCSPRRSGALADVKPIALQMPLRDVGHRFSFPGSCLPSGASSCDLPSLGHQRP